MENMIMDQVLGSPLLRKLQAMQSQTDCNMYMGPDSSLNDTHTQYDHFHHDALSTMRSLCGHTMLPPAASSSPLSPQDGIIDYLLAQSAFPHLICKKEEQELMLVSSNLPSCDALLGSTRHSLLCTNDDIHDFDSSYNTELLHYASTAGGSGRYSSSQPSLAMYASAMKEEASCLGVDVQECNVKEMNKDASCSLVNAKNPHIAMSASSSSTPTSMTSGFTCHANLQAHWMAFDDNHNSSHPICHGSNKLLHVSNMVHHGRDHHNGVSASITSHEKKKKRKRKRTSHKNIQEMESQRMTHITVERNRRKQMNEHLRALRMLMPHSYIQRGDQASIVGGTIRFVEELEQVLQALRLQKEMRSHQEYQTMNAKFEGDFGACMGQMHKHVDSNAKEAYACRGSCMANVEVTMMTSSTIFVKVLAQKRPHQLLHTLLALTKLSLKVMHLNVTASELITLYCFYLQMEDDCQLHTSHELAESIQHIFFI